MSYAPKFSGNISLFSGDEVTEKQPAVQVPVDMDRVRADQQQVDGGRSPWQLDPLQVAQTFLMQFSSESSPNGSPMAKRQKKYFRLVLSKKTMAQWQSWKYTRDPF